MSQYKYVCIYNDFGRRIDYFVHAVIVANVSPGIAIVFVVPEMIILIEDVSKISL